MKEDNLNTSHVKVKHMPSKEGGDVLVNLNTSHVKVKPTYITSFNSSFNI